MGRERPWPASPSLTSADRFAASLRSSNRDIVKHIRQSTRRDMGYFIPSSRSHNLRSYSYSGHDGSLLSKYILTPYWNNLVKIFPMSVRAQSQSQSQSRTRRLCQWAGCACVYRGRGRPCVSRSSAPAAFLRGGGRA